MNHKTFLPTKSFKLFLTSFAFVVASFKSIAQTPASAAVDGYPSGTVIPKRVFTSQPGIGVYVKATVFEIKYQVIGYTLKIADGEGGVREVACQGSAFSSLAKQAINDYAKPGGIISIQNIRARHEGGGEMKLPALVYYIE